MVPTHESDAMGQSSFNLYIEDFVVKRCHISQIFCKLQNVNTMDDICTSRFAYFGHPCQSWNWGL